MVEKRNKPNRKYSWIVRIDKQLKQPCKLIADAKNLEMRQFISDALKAYILEAEIPGA